MCSSDLVALGLGLAVICVLAVRRRLDAAAIAAAVIGLFLLTNKVYSPNYDLWLVPFFVLLAVPTPRWTAFWVADLAIYTLVFGHFHHLWGVAVVDAVLPVLVLVRAGAIVALMLLATASANGQRTVSASTTSTG